MAGAPVDLELLGHRASEAVLREHSLDRPLDHALGMRPQHRFGAHLFEAADVAGVPAILLVLELPSRELDLLSVDHDHVITDVEVRAETGLVLAAEDRRHASGQAPQHLPLRIHDVPLPLDVAFLGHRRRHGLPFGSL